MVSLTFQVIETCVFSFFSNFKVQIIKDVNARQKFYMMRMYLILVLAILEVLRLQIFCNLNIYIFFFNKNSKWLKTVSYKF